MNKNLLLSIIVSMGVLFFFIRRSSVCTIKQTTAVTNRIRVGTNADYPPFSFIEHDAIVGLDIDLIHAVGQRLGMDIELHNMAFTSLLPQLQLGMLDVIAAGMSPTPERELQAYFTKPHVEHNSIVALFNAKTPNVTSTTIIDYLKTKRVVVNEGFLADLYLSNLAIANQKVATLADGLMALRSGQAEVFVSGLATLQPFLEQQTSGQEFTTIELPNTNEPVALLVNKNNPELFKRLQDALETMRADGSLEQLTKKWLGQ